MGLASALPSAWINEIHYDNDDADVGEFVEVAGTAGLDLSGWSVLLYNGGSGTVYGTVYETIHLTGFLPNQEAGFGTLAFLQSGIQNGSPDGLALVDSGNTVVQFLSYEGTLTATAGVAAGMTSTDIGAGESSSTPAGYSLQLTGSGSSYADFTWAEPMEDSPDAINANQRFLPVADAGMSGVLLMGALLGMGVFRRVSGDAPRG